MTFLVYVLLVTTSSFAQTSPSTTATFTYSLQHVFNPTTQKFDVTTTMTGTGLTDQDIKETIVFYLANNGWSTTAGVGQTVSVGFKTIGEKRINAYVFKKNNPIVVIGKKLVVTDGQTIEEVVSSSSSAISLTDLGINVVALGLDTLFMLQNTPILNLNNTFINPYTSPLGAIKTPTNFEPIAYIPDGTTNDPFYILPIEIDHAPASTLPAFLTLNNYSAKISWTTENFYLHQVLVDGKKVLTNNVYNANNTTNISDAAITKIEINHTDNTTKLQLKNVNNPTKIRIHLVFRKIKSTNLSTDAKKEDLCAFVANLYTTMDYLLDSSAPIEIPISLNTTGDYKSYIIQSLARLPHDPCALLNTTEVCPSCSVYKYAILNGIIINDSEESANGGLRMKFIFDDGLLDTHNTPSLMHYNDTSFPNPIRLANAYNLDATDEVSLGQIFGGLIFNPLSNPPNLNPYSTPEYFYRISDSTEINKKVLYLYFPNAIIESYKTNSGLFDTSLSKHFAMFRFLLPINDLCANNNTTFSAGDDFAVQLESTLLYKQCIEWNDNPDMLVCTNYATLEANKDTSFTNTITVGTKYRPTSLLPFIGLNCVNMSGKMATEAISQTAVLQVLPNPSHNKVVIQYHQPTVQNYQISIYSLDGKIIHTEPVTKDVNTLVDVSNYAKGIYFVQITDSNGSQTTKLLVQ